MSNPEEQDQFEDLDYIEMIYPDVYHHPDIATMTEEEIYEEMDMRYFHGIVTTYKTMDWSTTNDQAEDAATKEIEHVASILYAHHHKEG